MLGLSLKAKKGPQHQRPNLQIEAPHQREREQTPENNKQIIDFTANAQKTAGERAVRLSGDLQLIQFFILENEERVIIKENHAVESL
jgi:hypothetical protein